MGQERWKKAGDVYRQILQLTGGQGDPPVARFYVNLGHVELHRAASTRPSGSTRRWTCGRMTSRPWGIAAVLFMKDWNKLLNVYNNISTPRPARWWCVSAGLRAGRPARAAGQGRSTSRRAAPTRLSPRRCCASQSAPQAGRLRPIHADRGPAMAMDDRGAEAACTWSGGRPRGSRRQRFGQRGLRGGPRSRRVTDALEPRSRVVGHARSPRERLQRGAARRETHVPGLNATAPLLPARVAMIEALDGAGQPFVAPRRRPASMTVLDRPGSGSSCPGPAGISLPAGERGQRPALAGGLLRLVSSSTPRPRLEDEVIPVDARGVDLDALDRALRWGGEAVVSVMAANETGVRNPQDIRDVCRRRGALFHCDATQPGAPARGGGSGTLDAAGPQAGRPPGRGRLVVGPRRGLAADPWRPPRAGLRGGTENIAAIADFGAAAAAAGVASPVAGTSSYAAAPGGSGGGAPAPQRCAPCSCRETSS